MRQINDFLIDTKFIDSRIKTAANRSIHLPCVVLSYDGNFVSVKLIAKQEGITKLENIPVIHSPNSYVAIEKDQHGILINLGQSTAGFFNDGSVRGDFYDIPEYVFVPCIVKSKANKIDKESSGLYCAGQTTTVELNKKAGLKLKTDQKLDIDIQKDISVKSQTKIDLTAQSGLTLKSNTPIDLNGSKLGQVLTKLATDLQTLQAAAAPVGVSWSPTSLTDLMSIASKIQ